MAGWISRSWQGGFQGHGRVDFAQYLRASANSNDNYAHLTESLTQLLPWQAKRSAVSAALTFNSFGHDWGGRAGGGGGGGFRVI